MKKYLSESNVKKVVEGSFDIVIDTIVKQAKEKHDLPLSKGDMEKFKNETFRIILEPAYSKLIDSMKMLVALPGKPTLFSGDDLGSTGYEEKTKNITKKYLQVNKAKFSFGLVMLLFMLVQVTTMLIIFKNQNLLMEP